MAEFIYNNTKNANIGHIFFKFNCKYHCYFFFKDHINSCLKFYLAEKRAKKQRNLMFICQQNLLYPQKLQKQVYDKVAKPYSYIPGKKVWLNSK